MMLLAPKSVQRERQELVSKSPRMWIVVLIVWFCVTCVWLPPLLADVSRAPVSYSLTVVPVFGWMLLATLLGVSQAASAAFAIMPDQNSEPARTIAYPVAILYTTMNDFCEPAALSCVSLNYPYYHVFLLDDSTTVHHQLLVEEFHARFPEKTTIIRRESREGFKAGNLNHALRLIHRSFPFFALADADTVLPKHFLQLTMNRFRSEQIAFVQGRMEVDRCQKPFLRELSLSQNLYWRRIVPASARYGFTMLHGHGAVIRTSVWKETGGFPHVVAEDLAFSTRARELGYIGIFASDVVCEEMIPCSFLFFSVRQLKYVRGAVEHMRTDGRRFMCCARIPWFEKLDRLSGSLCLLAPIPFLLSVVCAGIAQCIQPSSFFQGASWRLFIPTTVALLFPLVPAVKEFWKHPRDLAVYAFSSTCMHLSMTIGACADALAVSITRRNFFTPTGDLGGVRKTAAGISYSKVSLFLLLLAANWRHLNLTAIILISSMLATTVSTKYGWSHRIANGARCFPSLLIIFALLQGWPFEHCDTRQIAIIGIYSACL